MLLIEIREIIRVWNHSGDSPFEEKVTHRGYPTRLDFIAAAKLIREYKIQETKRASFKSYRNYILSCSEIPEMSDDDLKATGLRLLESYFHVDEPEDYNW